MKLPLSLLKHDTIEATEVRLEAYADALERAATTPEQRELARGLDDVRREVIDAMHFLAEPESVAKERGFEIEMDR